MTTDNKTLAVDVLAVMRQIADGEGDAQVLAMRARAAVAELIDAAEWLRNENKSLIRWECIVSWLLEKCEGESISQDLFEQEYAKMIADSIKAGGTA
nr:hypothetical protein [Stenotrophomonas geniculata]